MAFDMAALESFFIEYGKALASGDASEIAACYALPAMVVHGGGGNVVRSRAELVDAFAGLARSYREKGLYQATPVITRVELLGSQMVGVDVDWASHGQDGVPTGYHERYRYVLRHEHGEPRIQVVIALTSVL